MRVKINDYTLCDGSTQSPTNLNVVEKRQTQLATGLRWRQAKPLTRFNKETTITFEVIRTFGSIGEAEKFVVMHGTVVPESGLVEMQMFDKSSAYLTATEIGSVVSKHLGATTTHTYTIQGGEVTTTKPAP